MNCASEKLLLDVVSMSAIFRRQSVFIQERRFGLILQELKAISNSDFTKTICALPVIFQTLQVWPHCVSTESRCLKIDRWLRQSAAVLYSAQPLECMYHIGKHLASCQLIWGASRRLPRLLRSESTSTLPSYGVPLLPPPLHTFSSPHWQTCHLLCSRSRKKRVARNSMAQARNPAFTSRFLSAIRWG